MDTSIIHMDFSAWLVPQKYVNNTLWRPISVDIAHQSFDLGTIIDHHNPWINHLQACFGIENREFMFTLFTAIYPKSSRAGSNYPESC